MNVFEELRARGFVHQATSEDLAEILGREKVVCYAGFDPTSDSLHIGNLVIIMGLAWFQRGGHRPIVVMGGATGMIGDPSGKSKERNLLDTEQIRRNLEAQRVQFERFLDFGEGGALLVNNADWLGRFGYLEFLRDVGKHFRLGEMLAKETVKSRITSEAGISYTEFSYMMLQAYDFLHLSDTYGCSFQVGGGDQWGNVTSGIDLIRKLRGRQAHGIVFPLLLDSSGQKMGKTSEGERVWLDPEKTSPYKFYQHWINIPDDKVVSYLKFFTFLPLDEIVETERAAEEAPEKRIAQKRLAEEVTRIVHGEEGLGAATRATNIIFGGEITGVDEKTLADIFADVPSATLPRARLDEGIGVVDLLVESGGAKGKGAARRLIDGGGVYLNNRRVDSADRTVGPDDLVAGPNLVIRQGKKNYRLVKFE
ncbi:MAG: tyrosine--tRNA ligase [Candidatus Eisenbacteria bacterium]|nr:tyrosine--tRNA ligase [Candidatus Eisenbacteria bacterium]